MGAVMIPIAFVMLLVMGLLFWQLILLVTRNMNFNKTEDAYHSHPAVATSTTDDGWTHQRQFDHPTSVAVGDEGGHSTGHDTGMSVGDSIGSSASDSSSSSDSGSSSSSGGD